MKAFPIIDFENSEDGYIYFDQGMDLRDYFAAKAMQALLFDIKAIQVDMNKTADFSYRFADEMMRARER
jgi:hypothetical protein